MFSGGSGETHRKSIGDTVHTAYHSRPFERNDFPTIFIGHGTYLTYLSIFCVHRTSAMDPEACLGILSRAHAAAKGSDWERFNFSATGDAALLGCGHGSFLELNHSFIVGWLDIYI